MLSQEAMVLWVWEEWAGEPQGVGRGRRNEKGTSWGQCPPPARQVRQAMSWVSESSSLMLRSDARPQVWGQVSDFPESWPTGTEPAGQDKANIWST